MPTWPTPSRAAEPTQLRDIHIQVKLPEKLRQKLEAEKAAASSDEADAPAKA